eukprot:14656541-Alexandrium_andersonii.AAC.1
MGKATMLTVSGSAPARRRGLGSRGGELGAEAGPTSRLATSLPGFESAVPSKRLQHGSNNTSNAASPTAS